MKTIKFFFKSLVQNICILKEEQKWWYAITIAIISLVISVSGILSSGLSANVNSVIYSSTTSGDSAIDRSLTILAEKFDDNNKLVIKDGKLEASGIFASYTGDNKLTENSSLNEEIAPNVKIELDIQNSEGNVDSRTTVTSLAVFVFPELNPNYSSFDSTLLNNFLKKSVYKYGKASSEDTTDSAQWTPYSFIVITQTSIHMSTYKLVNATKSSTPIGSAIGDFKNFSSEYDLKNIFKDENGAVLDSTTIQSNFCSFINQAYSSIRVTNTWTSVGIYFAINVAIIFLSGFVLFFMTRKRELVDGLHYNFWQAQKVGYIEALTPAIISALSSLFMASYSTFVFLICIAIRTSWSISKLSNTSNGGQSDKPVYKARA